MRAVPFAIVLAALMPVGTSPLAQQVPAARVAPAAGPCGSIGSAFVRTTLYFGLTRPAGTVTEREWGTFLRAHVTPRFPDGLTVWEAAGQWRRPDGRIVRERSKVLLLVHDDTPATREALGMLVSAYKRMFDQESVLWESSMVCATL
jgi:Protein of unknown function (DUF3574)